jgi:hypothetical protein
MAVVSTGEAATSATSKEEELHGSGVLVVDLVVMCVI